MALICDAHVHLYSHYDLRRAFEHGVSNLNFIAAQSGLAPQTARALVLTERFDCSYFDELANARRTIGSGFAVRRTADPISLIIELASGEEVALIAGRQIVTAERLELLAVCSNALVPDGLAFSEAQRRVLDAGGLPTLNWAPGKWLFKRGRLVREILESADARSLVICDTWLRPASWQEPELMQLARRRGLTVIGGSDPLPFSREELRIGTYGIACPRDFDLEAPGESLRRLLLEHGSEITLVGARGTPAAVVGKLYKHHTAGKAHREEPAAGNGLAGRQI